jgi:hypothetical protein
MPQTAAEIAKDLAVAALHAQPNVVAPQRAAVGDESVVAAEVARLFTQIFNAIRGLPGMN